MALIPDALADHRRHWVYVEIHPNKGWRVARGRELDYVLLKVEAVIHPYARIVKGSIELPRILLRIYVPGYGLQFIA